nr:hypothetical protein [Tanacetum cinerariifolium]
NENVDDEEYKRINKETYDDVNVELKDAEPVNEEKGDEEMTHAENVNDEHKEVSQEVAGETKIISIMDIIVQHKDPSIQTSPLFTIHVMVLLTFKRKRKPDDADRDEDPPTGPDQ